MVTFTVEDGTGLPAANSFAALDEANDYFAKHLYGTGWAVAADDTTRQKALMMATRVIENMVSWIGSRKKPVPADQGLGWPRIPEQPSMAWGNPLALRTNMWINLQWPYDQVPIQVKWAACELALQLMTKDRTADPDTMGVKSVNVAGAIDVTFEAADRPNVLPNIVIDMLKPFGAIQGVRSSTIEIHRG